MINHLRLTLLLAAMCCAPVHAVTFEWATVGNPGNADDATGYGAVDYTYRISKYEVTNAQYVEFLNAVAASDPYGLYNANMSSSRYGCKIEQSGTDGSFSYSVASDREYRPVNYVSFLDAMRFVNWLHNGQGGGDTETGVYDVDSGVIESRSANARFWIPNEDEWYKAAYHKNDGVTGNYFDFPTSSDTEPVNTVVEPDPGNHANFYDVFGGQFATHSIGTPYYMTEVGEFENSPSPYGTFDQGGNVAEWVINSTYSSRGGSSTYVRARGGSWGESWYGMNGAAYSNSALPTDEYIFYGFRVATVPEPNSLLLVALAVGGFVLRVRRR